MKLYGALASLYVARVVLAAKAKGVDLVPQMPPGGMKSPEHLAMNPLGKIPAGVHQFLWDGAAMNGAASAAGQYSFTVEAKTAGSAVTANALSVGHVQGIIRGANGVQVDLGVLGTKAVDDVKEIL